MTLAVPSGRGVSELWQLADRLATSKQYTAAWLHEYFSLLGLRGSGEGLALLLDAIVHAYRELDNLHEHYPAVRPWIDLLVHAGLVARRLKSASREHQEDGRLQLAASTRVRAAPPTQTARFYTLIAGSRSDYGWEPRKLVVAAAYLVGVMRQASHVRLARTEAEHQDQWLQDLIDGLDLLAPIESDLRAALDPDKTNCFEDLCRLAQRLVPSRSTSSQSRNPPSRVERFVASLEMLRRFLHLPRAGELGQEVSRRFEELAKAGKQVDSKPPSSQAATEHPPSAPQTKSSETADEDLANESADEDDLPYEGVASDELGPSTEVQGTSEPRHPGATVDPAKGPPRSWDWGDRSSTRLSEREALGEFRRALGDDMQLDLSQVAYRSLTDPPRVLPGLRAPYEGFYEGLIAAVALALGRTIADACRTIVISYDHPQLVDPATALTMSRFIYIGQQSLGEGRHLYLSFADDAEPPKDLRETHWNMLQVPDVLGNRIKQLAPRVVCAELQELLPFVPEGWSERAGSWLTKRYDLSVGELNLAVRHALARELYAATANRALLDFACEPLLRPDGKSIRRIALSSYLYPGTKRDVAEHLRAATKLLSPVNHELPEVPLAPARPYVPLELSRFIARKLRELAEDRYLDLFDRHNAIALYTVVMLVVATGHRFSRSVFHFPWDLDLDAALAFICDKLKTGSEARFVPLAPSAAEQVRLYRHHLAWLVRELQASSPELARRVSGAAGFEVASTQAKGKATGASAHPVSQFFLFKGEAIYSIGSADVDRACQQALGSDDGYRFIFENTPGPRSITRRLRRNLATYIWTSGASGLKVEALLGHNREWHVYGDASMWSVLRDTRDIRDLIQQYLEESDWTPLALERERLKIRPRSIVPTRTLGTDGYEGREREKNLALARAKEAVRQAVQARSTSDEETVTFNDADFALLRSEVEESLSSDPAAQKEISLAFAALAAPLKRSGKIEVSAATINLQRVEPGPVEIGFARDNAIATAIRNGWAKAVKGRLSEASESGKDSPELRLAVLLSSLIVNDGLLDVRQLWPLLESAHLREARNAHGRIQLRAEVVTSTAAFERVVYLSRLSSAIVRGLYKFFPKRPTEGSLLAREAVEEHLEAMIGQVVRSTPRSKWTASALASVFRAWWFIRLPGFVYSVAIGRHDAPSANAISEATLLGGKPPRLSKLLARARHLGEETSNERIKEADAAVKGLLDEAAGDQVEGTQASKTQRAALRKRFATGLNPGLVALMSEVPIVEARVEFLEHLLLHGGLEEPELAFGTIVGYHGRLDDLFRAWWDLDPSDLSSEEFDEHYRKEIQRVESKANLSPAQRANELKLLMTALRTFHWFLRTKYSAPPSKVVESGRSTGSRRHPRNSLLAPRLLPKVLSNVRTIAKAAPELSQGATKVLLIGQLFGTRRKEALYSLVEDFTVTPESIRLFVHSNAANKLKNPLAGTRLVPWPLSSTEIVELLKGALKVEQAVARKSRHLFADPGDSDRLMPFSPVMSVAITALKAGTGDARMTYHGLRHGFGTTVVVLLTPPASHVPPIARIRQELKPTATIARALAELRPGRSAWPFFVDRAGMWHGNAGVDNLLDVYFHGGTWLLAEHADANSLDDDLNPAHWAAFLGMTRTNLVKLRTAWVQREGAETDVSDERVIAHYVEQLGLPRAEVVGDSTQADSDETVPEKVAIPLTCALADRLLVLRHEKPVSLDQLADIAANEHRVERREVDAFVAHYQEVLADTGITDFEPNDSEFALGRGGNRAGVHRKSAKRQDFLTRLERLARSQASKAVLSELLLSWRQRVDRRRPLLVARAEVDLWKWFALLRKAGLPEAALKVLRTGSAAPTSGFNSETVTAVAVSLDSATRFSRGDKGLAIAEYGLAIEDDVSRPGLRNADLHRALLTACAMMSPA